MPATSTAVLVAGWVKCKTGRDELVAITPAQRDELLNGALPCPACATSCLPTFELVALSEDTLVTTWRSPDGIGKRWMPGYLLRQRPTINQK